MYVNENFLFDSSWPTYIDKYHYATPPDLPSAEVGDSFKDMSWHDKLPTSNDRAGRLHVLKIPNLLPPAFGKRRGWA